MPLKILLAHNYYQQSGGEDIAVESEVRLLRDKGHEVIEYIEHNERIKGMNCVSVATQTHWSHDLYNKVTEIIKKEKPEIAHFHNTFFAMSPSVYYACQDENIPVVQTLHN